MLCCIDARFWCKTCLHCVTVLMRVFLRYLQEMLAVMWIAVVVTIVWTLLLNLPTVKDFNEESFAFRSVAE